MMHTNELALLLSELLEQMQQNIPGSGQCNKPGGKGKKSGKSSIGGYILTLFIIASCLVYFITLMTK